MPHEIPAWVPDGCQYFITINNKERGGTALIRQSVAPALLASIPIYERLGKWWVDAMVVMPDHLHLIARFSRDGVRPVIKPWKGFQAKAHGIDWQSDFFEHRLRNHGEFTEKMNYVLLNPVRKGLVSDWRDWPFTFVRGEW